MQKLALIAGVVAFALPAFAEDLPREAWECTLEERLARRLDRGARAKRIGDYSVKRGEPVHPATTDCVDGEVSPEVFLPHELFEQIVVSSEGHAKSSAWDSALRESGLDPEVFWRELVAIVNHYRAARRRLRSLVAGASGLSHEARMELEPEAAALRESFCPLLHEALEASRVRFGAARFDRFLYDHVARRTSMCRPESPDYETNLRSHATGCR